MTPASRPRHMTRLAAPSLHTCTAVSSCMLTPVPLHTAASPTFNTHTHPPTQAKEYGEAEVWMNERMMRTSPLSCAEFLGAFLDSPSAPVGPAGAAAGLGGCVWLVWRDEGECTLYDMMRGRDWPFNLEPLLLERPLRLPQVCVLVGGAQQRQEVCLTPVLGAGQAAGVRLTSTRGAREWLAACVQPQVCVLLRGACCGCRTSVAVL